MIEVNDITYSYGRRKAPVLEDFSLTFEENSIYGLLGKNGTGKSTLLYLLCGLLRPQRGSVRVDGQDVTARRPEFLSELFFVPEEFELPAVSMARYVELNRPFYPHFSQDVLDECLADFELPARLNLGELSMGQKKKAFMSFALATGTKYLLMDEPTNGLDIPSKSEFRRVVSRHMDGSRILIISTHQARDIDMLLDHVAIINGTRPLLSASTATVCERLCFEVRPVGQPTDDALYVQPTIQGNALVRRNLGGEDSQLDLELFFNAVLANADVLAALR